MLGILYASISNVQLLLLVSFGLYALIVIANKLINAQLSYSFKHLVLFSLCCIPPIIAYLYYQEGIDLDLKLIIIFLALFVVNYISTNDVTQIFIMNLNLLLTIALSSRLITLLYIKNISEVETNGVGTVLLFLEIFIGLMLSVIAILLKKRIK
jgi:hypothetical protein